MDEKETIVDVSESNANDAKIDPDKIHVVYPFVLCRDECHFGSDSENDSIGEYVDDDGWMHDTKVRVGASSAPKDMPDIKGHITDKPAHITDELQIHYVDDG